MLTALPTLKTLLLGAAGGALFSVLGIPMPWMLGALGACMIASQFVPGIGMPNVFREILQPVLGVSLGSFFKPSLLDSLSQWPEVIGILAIYIVAASLFGLFYFRTFAGFDLVTAFFSGVPGGLSDLTLVGASMGANIVLLGLVHAIRVVMVVVTMPFILSLLAGPPIIAGVSATSAPFPSLGDVGLLTGCGIVGYLIGRVLRLPAGATLGPLIVSAAVHLGGLTESSPPPMMINGVQIVLGAFVGVRFVGLEWSEFRSALFHGLVWGTGLLALSVGSALLCAHITGFGFPQLLLAFAPGGIAEMGLLTLTMGIDVALVTVCHVTRILIVYMIVPIVSRHPLAKTGSLKDTGFTDD